MDINVAKIKTCILNNKEKEIIELLATGFDPNYDGGWPIRLAARNGCYLMVKTLLQFGANPHLLSEAGASTLQLAVYSGKNWSGDNWNFLLPYYDSSQLADAAAVAIIFQNIKALEKILSTCRCNTNVPTTLTGKTVEQLAKGYKLDKFLTSSSVVNNQNNNTPTQSPRNSRQSLSEARSTPTLRHHQAHRNLSPSVARFFHQTANQASLVPRNSLLLLSPSNEHVTT